jgi:hypothetical protein
LNALTLTSVYSNDATARPAQKAMKAYTLGAGAVFTLLCAVSVILYAMRQWLVAINAADLEL